MSVWPAVSRDPEACLQRRRSPHGSAGPRCCAGPCSPAPWFLAFRILPSTRCYWVSGPGLKLLASKRTFLPKLSGRGGCRGVSLASYSSSGRSSLGGTGHRTDQRRPGDGAGHPHLPGRVWGCILRGQAEGRGVTCKGLAPEGLDEGGTVFFLDANPLCPAAATNLPCAHGSDAAVGPPSISIP